MQLTLCIGNICAKLYIALAVVRYSWWKLNVPKRFWLSEHLPCVSFINKLHN